MTQPDLFPETAAAYVGWLKFDGPDTIWKAVCRDDDLWKCWWELIFLDVGCRSCGKTVLPHGLDANKAFW
jgi:hypothetical protein